MEKLLINIQTSTEVPYTSFIPKTFKEIRNPPETFSGGVTYYNPVKCEELPQSFDFDPDFNTHVYAAGLTENGKILSIFEQDGCASLSLHKYQITDSGKIEATHSCHRQTWLIRDYDFTVSYDGSFVVMFNSEENAHERDHRRRRKRGYGLGEKVCISILSFQSDVEIPKASFYPNSYILTFSSKHSHTEGTAPIWKYRHGYTVCCDSSTIIVATWGVTRDLLDDDDDLNEEVLFLDFFFIDASHNKIKHIRQLDLSCLLELCPLPIVFKDPHIVCNKKMDKILIESHDVVYMVHSHTVVQVSDTMYEDCHWVNDKLHGEAIVSIDQSFLLQGSNVRVKVFKQDDTQGDFRLCNDYSTRDLFNAGEEHSYFCHGISDVNVCLCIEPRWFNRKLYLVNPFSSNIESCLVIPDYIKEPYIRKVLVNRTEIVIVIKSMEKEIVCIYEIRRHQKICSLKDLCSVTLLQLFSLKQIKELNIPKVLQLFLEDFLM